MAGHTFTSFSNSTLAMVLEFKLFYHILTKNNNRLLVLYTEILYNATLLRRATDFAVDNTATSDFADIFPKDMLGVYLLNGSLSQLVNIYLSRNHLFSFDGYLQEALSVYLQSIGLDSTQRTKVFLLADEALSAEIKDRCFEGYLASSLEYTEQFFE